MRACSEPVRIGIVGVGSIGRRHLHLATAEPGCRVAALADPARAVESVAARAGVHCYASHAQMLARENLDGVIVAAPTRLHAPIGVDLASAGIPMLVEKPFADALGAGMELVAAASGEGVPVCVGHHRRFDPAVIAAREILASGRIGRLIGVSGLWADRKPGDYFDVPWRREAGGGPVLINMIHDIDMLRCLCGEVDRVYAETTSLERGLPVEDGGAIVLRFPGGALATISFSDAAPSPWGWERSTADNPAIPPSGENCYRFFGTEGAFEFPAIRMWRTEPGGEPNWNRSLRAESLELPERAALAHQLRNFCRVIRGQEEPVVSGEEGLATLAVALAVLESARCGRPVSPARLLAGRSAGGTPSKSEAATPE